MCELALVTRMMPQMKFEPLQRSCPYTRKKAAPLEVTCQRVKRKNKNRTATEHVLSKHLVAKESRRANFKRHLVLVTRMPLQRDVLRLNIGVVMLVVDHLPHAPVVLEHSRHASIRPVLDEVADDLEGLVAVEPEARRMTRREALPQDSANRVARAGVVGCLGDLQ